MLRHRGPPARRIRCGHRAEELVAGPVVVLVVEEDDRDGALSPRDRGGSIISVAGRPSGRSPPSISLFSAAIRSASMPSNVTTVPVPSISPFAWVSARAYASAASSASATTVRQFRSVAGTPSSDSMRAFERREPVHAARQPEVELGAGETTALGTGRPLRAGRPRPWQAARRGTRRASPRCGRTGAPRRSQRALVACAGSPSSSRRRHPRRAARASERAACRLAGPSRMTLPLAMYVRTSP